MEKVLVASPEKLVGAARVELVESASRRWSLNVGPAGPMPDSTAWFEVRFTRPTVVDMICGSGLPTEGFVTVLAPAIMDINTSSLPAGVIGVGAGPSQSTSFLGGSCITLPISQGLLLPTLLTVPVPVGPTGHRDLRVSGSARSGPRW